MILKITTGIAILLFMAVAGLLLISSFSIPGFPLDARAVQTGSMEPAIPVGSIVFIRPATAYAEGDIITFRRAESGLEVPVTHRVMRVEETAGARIYTTQGDANGQADMNPVRHADVLGKVAFHIPYIGYLLDAAKTPFGFAGLVVVPALLVIFEEGRKLWRQVRRNPAVKTQSV